MIVNIVFIASKSPHTGFFLFYYYPPPHPSAYVALHAHFWLKNQGTYPTLYKAALDIFACSATEASSERVFAQCTIACRGAKANLSAERT